VSAFFHALNHNSVRTPSRHAPTYRHAAVTEVFDQRLLTGNPSIAYTAPQITTQRLRATDSFRPLEVKYMKFSSWKSHLILSVLILLVASCGEEDRFSEVAEPHVEERLQGGEVNIVVGDAEVGEESQEPLELVNTGKGMLVIESISLVYESPSADETEDDPALKLKDLPEFPLEIAPLNTASGEQVDRLRFYVVFKRLDSLPRNATMVIRTNDPTNSKLEIPIIVAEGKPVMVVNPDVVTFKNVHAGDIPRKTVTILNTGDAKLVLDRMVLLGSNVFSLVLGENIWDVNEEINLESLEIGAQQSTSFEVQFTPENELPAEGELVIFSNASDDGFKVPIEGNNRGPCIEVSPETINFGAKLKGGNIHEIPLEIKSCGQESLQILEARLSTSADEADDLLSELGAVASSPQFDLDFTETNEGVVPNPDNPWEIAINATGSITVRYTTPDTESPVNENGTPIPDRGHVILRTNAFTEYVPVEVTGFSVEVLCPTAIIEIAEGTNVIPQTTLHLDGSASFSPSGAINKYEWSVVQPSGSKSQFLPNSSFPTPIFEVNAAGEYIFELDVWDTTGQESCETAAEVVIVTPDEAIHVELLWHTPGDLNEFDEGPRAGTDLDLHFVLKGDGINAYAGGQDLDGDGESDGYFDDIFDCFWYNNHPDWGSIDPNLDDNPGLDRDDTDGAGPENMNLNVPENGMIYKVGVHYWQDPKSPEFPNGFGYSEATVRVFIFGTEVWKKSNVQLVEKDMWEVTEISWPDQSVTPLFGDGPGGLKIIANYINPFFL